MYISKRFLSSGLAVFLKIVGLKNYLIGIGTHVRYLFDSFTYTFAICHPRVVIHVMNSLQCLYMYEFTHYRLVCEMNTLVQPNTIKGRDTREAKVHIWFFNMFVREA